MYCLRAFSRNFMFLTGIFFLQMAHAFEPMPGNFIATQTCSAGTSTRGEEAAKQTVLVVDRSYPVLGLNKQGGDFVQIRIPELKPDSYWVNRTCGKLVGADKGANQFESSQGRSLLLALSWQPAFCETHSGRTECTERVDRPTMGARFSLHGLWLEPGQWQYCNVDERLQHTDESKRWDALPEPPLGVSTRSRLAAAMPGLASNLHRHEWIRHGVCFGMNADRYFTIALNLLDQVNGSLLGSTMSQNQGKTVTASALKAEFERSYGSGAGRSLGVYCNQDDSRRLISEIRIRLKYPVDETTKVQDAIDLGSSVSGNCEEGIVDQPGSD